MAENIGVDVGKYALGRPSHAGCQLGACHAPLRMWAIIPNAMAGGGRRGR